MYLPWAYDFSQVTIFVCYIMAGFHGTSIWSEPVALLAGLSCTDVMKVTLYFGSVFTMVVAVKNVVDVWRNGTCKQPNLIESFRPWGTI